MNKPVEKYCAFCGRPFENPESGWPKTCKCGEITYRNPIPCVNAIVPVLDNGKTGVLVIQRGIEPCLGKWALPGGFMELHETWQEGTARELWEETSLIIEDPDQTISLCAADVNPKKDRLLIFGVVPAYTITTLPHIPTNDEVLDSKIIFEPEELAFPPHTRIVREFLEKFNSGK